MPPRRTSSKTRATMTPSDETLQKPLTVCPATGSLGDKTFQEPRHPTIAISDAFNCAGHVLGAVFVGECLLPKIGLGSVAVAAFFGVLRFGICPAGFQKANYRFAELASLVGLPLVGFPALFRLGCLQWLCWPPFTLTNLTSEQDYAMEYFVLLLFLYGLFTSYLTSELQLNLCRTVMNLIFFIAPWVFLSYLTMKWEMLSGVLLFVIAGVAVGADRERYLLGVRRENLFHYLIGAAAIIIGWNLPSVASADIAS